MIKDIYKKRYGKILLGLMGLVVAFSLWNGYNTVHNWQQNKDFYYNDKQIRLRFEENPEDYVKYVEGKDQPQPYDSYQEYADDQLYVFTAFDGSQSVKTKEYDPNTLYTNNIYSNGFTYLIFLLAGLVGFLIFFVDNKTNFNRFLFSLGQSRKELFLKKMQWLVLPFLTSILVGLLGYALIFYYGIPQPFMNATLGQLLMSTFSCFSFIVLVFTACMFVGALTGNVFFGPLTGIVLGALLFYLPSTVDSLQQLDSARQGLDSPYLSQIPVGTTLFLREIGKNGGFLVADLIIWLIALLLIFWMYRKYQTVSLENDNDFLLNPESRWPIWCIMTTFTAFEMIFGMSQSWTTYFWAKSWDDVQVPLSVPILDTLIWIVACAVVCFVIVFFSSIKRWWRERRQRKLALR